MDNQKQLVTKKKTAVRDFVKYSVVPTAVILATNANAAEFTLDTTSIMTAIGTTVAAVTAVGMGAMSIYLVVKALKYIKTAF